MPTLNSYTPCQVAPADTQAKTWQRVCLLQRTTDRQSGRKKNTERTTAVWRNGGFSASYDSFVAGSSGSSSIELLCEKSATTPSCNPLVAMAGPQHNEQKQLTKNKQRYV